MVCAHPLLPFLISLTSCQKNPPAFVSDPGDSPPVLLIGGLDRILTTQLNGSSLQTLRPVDTNGTLSLDFNSNEESVCWVVATDSSGRLRCAKMRNRSGFTEEREIKTSQSLQSMSYLALSIFLLLYLKLFMLTFSFCDRSTHAHRHTHTLQLSVYSHFLSFQFFAHYSLECFLPKVQMALFFLPVLVFEMLHSAIYSSNP